MIAFEAMRACLFDCRPLGLDVLGEHDQDAHKEDQRMEGWVVDWTRHGCCLRAFGRK